MAGVRSKPRKNGKYQGWFVDQTGQRVFRIGTRSKTQTLRMLQRLEDDERQIRLGYREVPLPAHTHASRPIEAVIDEYLTWGTAHGGRGGRPWGAVHGANRIRHLRWWVDYLGLQVLRDLQGCLPLVERGQRALHTTRAGKTVANYVESLAAFCDWCVRLQYLTNDPLVGLGRVDVTPQSRRRALTADDVMRILQVCPMHRRVLYTTDICSGLRKNELRQLTVHHLDTTRGGLWLDADWTKNRKQGFQPLPQVVIRQLETFAATGEAARLYRQAYGGRPSLHTVPVDPLLYVPTHTARELDKDLAAAGIPKTTAQGQVDFHALRTAFINLLQDIGLPMRDTQALARHSTLHMTGQYNRSSNPLITQALDKLAELLHLSSDRAPSVHHDDGVMLWGDENPFVSQHVITGGSLSRSRVQIPSPALVPFPHFPVLSPRFSDRSVWIFCG